MATAVKVQVKLNKKLINDLSKIGNVSVNVGYRTEYALRVHESTQMLSSGPRGRGRVGSYWHREKYGGEAEPKFLENIPILHTQQIVDKFRREIQKSAKIGNLTKKTVTAALLKAGEYVLKESRKLVPVETGALHDSGYVEEAKDSGNTMFDPAHYSGYTLEEMDMGEM